MPSRTRVSLALGSGGARGDAHIGAIDLGRRLTSEAMDAAGLP